MAKQAEMGERMARMEEKVDNLNEKMDEFIKAADKKYAPRWVVTILSWIAGIFGIVISAGLIKLFFGV